MRHYHRPDARTIIGAAAVALAFALLSPGVRLARAGDGSGPAATKLLPSVDSGGSVLGAGVPLRSTAVGGSTCSAAPAAAVSIAEILAHIERAANESGELEEGAVLPLKSNGYNYASGKPHLQPRLLRFESQLNK